MVISENTISAGNSEEVLGALVPCICTRAPWAQAPPDGPHSPTTWDLGSEPALGWTLPLAASFWYPVLDRKAICTPDLMYHPCSFLMLHAHWFKLLLPPQQACQPPAVCQLLQMASSC